MRLGESSEPIATRTRSMPSTCDRAHRLRSHRPTATSSPSTRTPATAAIAHRLRLVTDDLHQQLLVPADGNEPVGLGDDVLAPAPAHLGECELSRVRTADRLGEQLRPTRRNDDAASDPRNELRGLTLRLGGDEHGPADGEDAVETARDDVAGESAREADHMQVGG